MAEAAILVGAAGSMAARRAWKGAASARSAGFLDWIVGSLNPRVMVEPNLGAVAVFADGARGSRSRS